MSWAQPDYGAEPPIRRRSRPLKPAEPLQLELVDLANREPISRRTFSKVRRDSFPAGACEAAWWSPFRRKDVGLYMLAAERFDDAGKAKGDRRGPLGYTGLKILRALLRMIDYRSGRLDPCLETLMLRTKLCRGAVVAGLARLRRHGFVAWIRRFVPTGRGGMRGPQVEQTSNAYRVSLPERARRLVQRLAAPLPECVERDRAARAAQSKAWRNADDSNPLVAALDRWGAKLAGPPEPSASLSAALNPGRGST